MSKIHFLTFANDNKNRNLVLHLLNNSDDIYKNFIKL